MHRTTMKHYQPKPFHNQTLNYFIFWIIYYYYCWWYCLSMRLWKHSTFNCYFLSVKRQICWLFFCFWWENYFSWNLFAFNWNLYKEPSKETWDCFDVFILLRYFCFFGCAHLMKTKLLERPVLLVSFYHLLSLSLYNSLILYFTPSLYIARSFSLFLPLVFCSLCLWFPTLSASGFQLLLCLFPLPLSLFPLPLLRILYCLCLTVCLYFLIRLRFSRSTSISS